MRRVVLAAFLLALPAVSHASSLKLHQLDPEKRAERQEADLEAVSRYRAGVSRLIEHARSRTDLFPPARLRSPRLLKESEREEVRALWKSLMDYYLALDSIARYHAEHYALAPVRGRAPSFHVSRSAFLAQYRFGLELIDLAERDRKLAVVLNDPVPELGLPRGSYDRFKLRYLNVAASSQLTAFTVLARTLPAPGSEEAARAAQEDEAAVWKTSKGKRQILTVANSLNVVKKLGQRVSFPVQAGVSEWMGDTRVLRQGRALISQAQIESTLRPRIEPGDVMLQRREWYVSNVGLPGYWSHAALYVGTPAERRARFDAPEVRHWVSSQGEPSGDFERLLERLHPRAYAQSLRVHEDGHVSRVLEAISEGVVFTTLEHSADADSVVVLRPRLPLVEKAQAIARAFRYTGRPYDFNFDFQTDSALVCTELVYKAYEPASNFRGLRLSLEEIVGRTAIPANSIARQFDEESAKGAPQFDMVLFLDGQERQRTAVESTLAEFRRSWRRPKWHVLVQSK